MKAKVVEDINELKELCKGESKDFFILLNYGLKSSKRIDYDEEEKTFFVYNLIDDTEQELTEEQILDKEYTNIGEALKKQALIWEGN